MAGKIGSKLTWQGQTRGRMHRRNECGGSEGAGGSGDGFGESQVSGAEFPS